MTIRISAFWDMMLCSLMNWGRHLVKDREKSRVLFLVQRNLNLQMFHKYPTYTRLLCEILGSSQYMTL